MRKLALSFGFFLLIVTSPSFTVKAEGPTCERSAVTILDENQAYVGLSMSYRLALASPTNCSAYTQACDNFAADWYVSCVVLGGFNCFCRSLELYNGCMVAHGCEGHSPFVMEQVGCT